MLRIGTGDPEIQKKDLAVWELCCSPHTPRHAGMESGIWLIPKINLTAFFLFFYYSLEREPSYEVIHETKLYLTNLHCVVVSDR